MSFMHSVWACGAVARRLVRSIALLAIAFASPQVMHAADEPSGEARANSRAAADTVEQARTSTRDFYGDPLPEGAISRIGTVRMRDMFTSAAALSPDGSTFATTGYNGEIHFVDVATGKTERTLRFDLPGPSVLAWSPDGKTLAAWSQESNPPPRKSPACRITVVDLGSHALRYAFEGPSRGTGLLDFSADSQRLIVCKRDACHVFDVSRTGAIVERIGLGTTPSSAPPCLAYCRRLGVLAWANKNDLIQFRRVVPADGQGEAESGPLDDWLPPDAPAASDAFQERKITSLAFSDSGDTLAVAWGLSHDSFARFDPEAAHPYVAGEFEILLHEFPSGRARRSIQGARSKIRGIAFSPDGSALASREQNYTRVWNIADGTELFFSPIGPATPQFFSHDGQRLFLNTGGGVDVLYLRTGTMSLEAHGAAVSYSALSGDGALLATSSSGDHTIRTWDVATGRPLAKLVVARLSDAGKIAFVDDARLLAATHADHVVLRDPRTLNPASPIQIDATEIKGVVRDKFGVALGGPSVAGAGQPECCVVGGLAAQASGRYVAVQYARVNRALGDGRVAHDVIAVYDATGTKPMREVAAPAGEIKNIDIAASAPILAYSHSEGKRAFCTVFDIAAQREIWRFEPFTGYDAHLSLPRDGKRLFIALHEHRETYEDFKRKPIPDCKLQVWDIATRRLLKETLPRGVTIQRTPLIESGKFIVTYSVQRMPTRAFISLWRGESDQPRFTRQVPSSRGFSLSANEKRVVIGESRGTSLLCYEISDIVGEMHTETQEKDHQ